MCQGCEGMVGSDEQLGPGRVARRNIIKRDGSLGLRGTACQTPIEESQPTMMAMLLAKPVADAVFECVEGTLFHTGSSTPTAAGSKGETPGSLPKRRCEPQPLAQLHLVHIVSSRMS